VVVVPIVLVGSNHGRYSRVVSPHFFIIVLDLRAHLCLPMNLLVNCDGEEYESTLIKSKYLGNPLNSINHSD
jgi:hypothetical protein